MMASIHRGQPRAQNRNVIVRKFLDSTARWLLMVDDDIAPPEDALERLLKLNKPVSVGICPIYCRGDFLMANVADSVPTATKPALWPHWINWDSAADPFQVACAGTGVILCHRTTYERLGYPWFVEYYGDERGQYAQSEDIYFCRRLQEEGIPIWCHPGVVCEHYNVVGLAAYAKAVLKMAELAK